MNKGFLGKAVVVGLLLIGSAHASYLYWDQKYWHLEEQKEEEFFVKSIDKMVAGRIPSYFIEVVLENKSDEIFKKTINVERECKIFENSVGEKIEQKINIFVNKRTGEKNIKYLDNSDVIIQKICK